MLEILKQIDLGLALLALAITYWAWRNGRMTKELLKEWRDEDRKSDERWQIELKKRDEEWRKRDEEWRQFFEKRDEEWHRFLEKNNEEWRRFFDNFDKRHAEYQKSIMEALTKISENLARR